MTPLDLVTLPGGQYVSLITTNTYYIAALAQGATVILPCLKITTADWMLMDMASSSVASRVRTNCNLRSATAGDDVPGLGLRGRARRRDADAG